MENKPFIFGVATSGDNFTDREKETLRLVLNFQHGVNTVLISPRRWGKTSLVQKACGLAQSDKLKIVYLDIFSCRSDRDFYDAFASAILKQTSSKLDEWLEHAKLFLAANHIHYKLFHFPLMHVKLLLYSIRIIPTRGTISVSRILFFS